MSKLLTLSSCRTRTKRVCSYSTVLIKKREGKNAFKCCKKSYGEKGKHNATAQPFIL